MSENSLGWGLLCGTQSTRGQFTMTATKAKLDAARDALDAYDALDAAKATGA